MDFSLTPDQQNIRDAILEHCARFPDEYWLERDREGLFPRDFFDSMVEAGWLGIAMPAEFGGSGLGITEAAVMMQAIAESGACMSGAASVHIPVFSLQPVVLFGTPEQKQRFLPPGHPWRRPGVLCGHRAQCGVEYHGARDPCATGRRRLPGERRENLDLHRAGRQQDAAPGAHHAARRGETQTAGLSLFYTSLDRSKIDVRPIHKMGRHAVERYLRESLIPRAAPVSPHMILNFLAEKVLELPKSY